MKTLILTILAGLVCLASARLGETPEQCIARYGELIRVEKDRNLHCYRKNGINIEIRFKDGKAGSIDFFKEASAPNGGTAPLSVLETAALMTANDGGSKWKQLPPKPGDVDQVWFTEDGKCYAEFWKESLTLHMATVEFQRFLRQEAQDGENEKLKSF
jgi:hypothetical protein